MIGQLLKKDWIKLLASLHKAAAASLRKGRERQRLMLVPHSGKKIITLNIPNYAVFLFVVSLVVIITLSVISLNVRESSHSTINKLANVSELQRSQIALFKEKTRYVSQNFFSFWHQMNKLSYGLGYGGGDGRFPFSKDNKLFAEYSSEMVTTNTVKMPKEVRDLEKLNLNLRKSAEQLSTASAFLKNLKQVVRYIPSGWPVSGGGFVTSPFGRRRSPFTGAWQHHNGIDISWWPGSPLIATAAGKVVEARWIGGYGLCVLIQHKYGFMTRYGHMQSLRVSAGEYVEKRQVLGAMGSTGLSTGYHIHYEVIYKKKHINPGRYLINRF